MEAFEPKFNNSISRNRNNLLSYRVHSSAEGNSENSTEQAGFVNGKKATFKTYSNETIHKKRSLIQHTPSTSNRLKFLK